VLTFARIMCTATSKPVAAVRPEGRHWAYVTPDGRDQLGPQLIVVRCGTGLQDDQAPRISYTANEQVMPRPRGGVGGVQVGQPQAVVSLASIDKSADTISVTEFTDYLNAVSGTGPGGTAYKSHRPSDALAKDSGGTTPYDTSNAMTTDRMVMPTGVTSSVW
jgi:hypothetical protein